MKRIVSCLFGVVVAVWLVTIAGQVCLAQGTPDVLFKLNWITSPNPGSWTVPESSNADGKVVGHHQVNGLDRGFLYVPPASPGANGTFLDIDEIVDTSGLVQNGWIISDFVGMNELDAIVGYVENAQGDRAGILVDMGQDPPTLEFLPNLTSDWSYGRRINNFGDIVGPVDRVDGSRDVFVYNTGMYNELYQTDLSIPWTPLELPGNASYVCHVNNLREVLARVFTTAEVDPHYIFDIPMESLTLIDLPGDLAPSGFNDLGQICGTTPYVQTGKGRNRTVFPDSAFRFRNGPSWQDDVKSYANGLNASGDVLFTVGDEPFVYTDEWGKFAISPLVVSDNPIDLELWLTCDSIISRDIADRDSTGMGSICGWLSFLDGGTDYAFVLTPFVPGETPNISVFPTSGLTTTELGDQTTFEVVLDTEPAADVTISFSSSDISEGTVSPASVTFTPGDWDTPQTVTVTGVDDAIEDDDQGYMIEIAAATSADPEYNGRDADDVSVTNLDNDGPLEYSSEDTPLAIPDYNPGNPVGISSTIPVEDDVTIFGLTVTLDITHQQPLDLDVFLFGPNNGPPVALLNFNGANDLSLDFFGSSSIGDWTIEIYDRVKKKTGTLNGWSITIDAP